MKRTVLLAVAFLFVPTLAFASGIGKCVSQCVHDLGGQANPLCVKACKDGMATGACTYATDGCCNEYFEEIDQDCASGYVPNGGECYYNRQCVSGMCDIPDAGVGLCIGLPQGSLCTTSEQCGTDLYCTEGGACVPKIPVGSANPCQYHIQCTTGYCSTDDITGIGICAQNPY